MSSNKANIAIDQLRTVLPAGAVISDAEELFVYESDAFTIAKARPSAVLFPTSVEHVVAIVKALAKYDVQIIPRGSGTGLTGGCVAFDDGVLVSTARMNRILTIDLDNRVAHVQAGVRNTALSDAVAQLPGLPQAQSSPGSAFHFSPDPSSQRASTIGGNASTNAGGIHVLKDFTTSSHVLGMTMVLTDGSVAQIGAHNGCYEAGFDLSGLICGSEGTLGIITSLWVRLIPKATSFRTSVSLFNSTSDACRAVSEVIATGFLPSAMELLDGKLFQVVNEAFHLGLPVDTQALILTEIDGVDELLDDQMEQISAIMRKNGATSVESTRDEATRAKLWKARKGAFGAFGRVSPSACTQDACVPRSSLASVLQKIAEIGKEHGLVINNVFHAGDGNVHPIFLYDDRDESQVQNVLEASEKVLKYCIDVGGTITGEHGVGVEKIALMSYQFDEPTMRQFDRVKRAFDPDERINAGKLIPSDKVQVHLLKPGRRVPQ